MDAYDVMVIGGGPAGLSASIFTARNGLETVVIEDGYSILRRNAHLENFLGFPAGVNSRLLLKMGRDQAERNGADYREDTVETIARQDDGDRFRVETSDGGTVTAQYVISASWANVFHLEELGVDTYEDGSKTYVDADPQGRTNVDGVYAAGRIAGQYHQTIINAGHGAEVAVTVLEEHDADFYHDWVAPEGYFTGRDREVPPGCEEIPEDERLRREHESIDVMQEYFAEPFPETPRMHPSVQQRETDD